MESQKKTLDSGYHPDTQAKDLQRNMQDGVGSVSVKGNQRDTNK